MVWGLAEFLKKIKIVDDYSTRFDKMDVIKFEII